MFQEFFSISLQVVVIVHESATAAQTHSQVPFWAHPFHTGLFLHPDIWDPKNRSNTKPLGWYFIFKGVKMCKITNKDYGFQQVFKISKV